MCGLLGGEVPIGAVWEAIPSIAHRGPDAEGVQSVGGFALGHVRLAVQDLSHASDQPFTVDGTTITYNGEMWRPHLLRQRYPYPWKTGGDTEAVAVALARQGTRALPYLLGMFAVAWVGPDGDLYLARDEYGEVPLHYGFGPNGALLYASEIKTLLALGAVPSTVRWVEPGTYLHVRPGGRAWQTRWARDADLSPMPIQFEEAASGLRELLRVGTLGRMTSDAPVAVLASGGLDSSAVLGLLVEAGQKPTTYTAVYDPKSSDLRHAREVTRHLGLELVEVPVPAPSADDLARMVRQIEMPHKAQVEIAVGCDALAQAISADGFKVVLSGEGSDELWASYGMAYHGIKKQGWHPYRHDLFTGQHRKNFPRTNKIFMRYGVEARLPFLHVPLARYALRLPQEVVNGGGGHPKAVLAAAVNDLLPKLSVWRAKVAFQKGAGLDQAAGAVVENPTRFYRETFGREFQGVKP